MKLQTTAAANPSLVERARARVREKWSHFRAQAMATWTVVVANPTLLVAPLLVFGLVVGLGVGLTLQMAKVEERGAKDRAASLARDMATWYQVQLTGVTAGLTGIMAALVRYQPIYAGVSELFDVVGPVLLEQATANSVKLVQLAPNGWARDTFPKTLEPKDLDLFALSTDQEAALETVRSRQLTLQGPTPFVQGGYGVIVRRPIFIGGVNDTSGFGMPAPLNPICGAPCAYNNATKSVFWGFAAVLIDLVVLNSAPDSRPRMMDGLGYRYEVRALGLAAANMRLVAASSTLPGHDAMEAIVSLPNNQWVVRVAPAGGWTSNYYGGLIAAVVVLAFALSVFLFAALVLWRRHQMLLSALLPRKVIRDLHNAGGAALAGACSRMVLNTDTTADVMLRVLAEVVCGEAPAISDVMLVRSALAHSADIYEPIIGITEQIHGAHMDRDVADSLARQLCTAPVGTATALPRHITWQRSAGPGGRLLPRCAAPPSAASVDTSYRDSSVPLSYSEAAGEAPQQARGGGAGDYIRSLSTRLAGGFRRAGSKEAVHLSNVFVALPSAAARQEDSSELMRTITGLLPPAASGSLGQATAAVRPESEAPGERTGAVPALGSSLQTGAPYVAPVAALGAPSAATAAPLTAGVMLAVAAVAPAEELTLSTTPVLAAKSTATLLESAVSDHVAERNEASRMAAEDPGSAVAGGSSACGCNVLGVQPPPVVGAPLAVHTSGDTPAAALQAASPPAQVHGLRSCTPGGGSVPPASVAAASSAAANGGSSLAAPADVPPEAAEKLQPLHDIARATSYRRQRTSQLTDEQEAIVVPTDSEDSEDGDAGLAEAGAARGLGNGTTARVVYVRQGPHTAHAGGGHSGSIRHVSGSHLSIMQMGKGAGSISMQRSQHSGVRVSASARVRGLIYGSGPHQQHQHLQPGSTSSSAHAAARRPKRQSNSGVVVPGAPAVAGTGEATAGGSGAAAGKASTSREAVAAVAGGSASPYPMGGVNASVTPQRQQHMAMMPPRALMEEVEQVLAGADAWQFDTWRLAEVSGGLPLSVLGYFLIQRAGLVKTLRLSPRTLVKCLRVIEAGYHDNPYHSATHAADVLQTLHVIIHSAQLQVHYLDPLGLFAAYWAAIVHDYRHPGLTGDFLITTAHPLAIRYNDRSPLENHHSAASFSVLRRRGLELLQPLPAESRATFRKQVIEMVLATDMKQHFALCSQFSTVHRLSAFSAERAKAAAAPMDQAAAGAPPRPSPRGNVLPRGGSLRATELQEVVVAGQQGPPAAASGGSRMGGPAPQPLDESERLLAMCIALKAADLGHLGEELEVHKRWLAGLEEEFFRQGDQERELGIPISPLFDRAKQGVSKSQVGFYEFVGLPIVHALTSAFPGAAPLMTCFTTNYLHWLRVQQEAQAHANGQ